MANVSEAPLGGQTRRLGRNGILSLSTSPSWLAKRVALLVLNLALLAIPIVIAFAPAAWFASLGVSSEHRGFLVWAAGALAICPFFARR
jgi:hypothetical protein